MSQRDRPITRSSRERRSKSVQNNDDSSPEETQGSDSSGTEYESPQFEPFESDDDHNLERYLIPKFQSESSMPNTSTPNDQRVVNLQRRRPIHEPSAQPQVSPIPKPVPVKKNVRFSPVVPLSRGVAASSWNLNPTIILGIVLFLIVCVCGTYYIKQTETVNLDDVKKAFPEEKPNFWLHLKSGIDDVVNPDLDHPSVFLFLHTWNNTNKMHQLLNKLAKYAICRLHKDCSVSPIVLDSEYFKKPEIVEDYGRVIDELRNQLEMKGVMVVKNLQDISGVSAQAFHSFCDEYNPLVSRAVFFISMAVDDEIPDNYFQYTENILRNRWSDIKDDIFHPLFTRIANTVLPVI